MHREQLETIGLKDIAKALNMYSLGELSRAKLVKLVCLYFDQMKTKNLTERDKAFLFYAATEAGVPQYYDILRKTFNTDTQIKDWGMLELSSHYHNLTLYTSPNNKLHKMQKEIFDLFKTNQINRYFLSASTSFGKTYLVYEILKKMKYRNILLIFPTIALLSENLEKILKDTEYDFLRQYNIITLSDVSDFQDKNRFLYHYSGRVIVLQNNFMDVLYADEAILEHKNYDKTSQKTDIDLDYTQDNYLSEEDLRRKKELNKLALSLPAIVVNQFKTISKQNKVLLFNNIEKLNSEQLYQLKKCISSSIYDSLDFDGFQVFLDTIKDIASNSPIATLINNTAPTRSGKIFSVLVYMVSNYLKGGFQGEVQYYIEKKNLDYDSAVRKTADFIYNKLKYHLVKYLGIFNLIYKYRISRISKCEIDDVTGFDRLLSKFEYNAYTEKGKIASDYGAPDNVVKYIENINDELKRDKIKLDRYEKDKLNDVLNIISIK